VNSSQILPRSWFGGSTVGPAPAGRVHRKTPRYETGGARSIERPTALPNPRRRAAVRLRCHRRALSGVPDWSLMNATFPG
jgi:hypothetical protein